MESKGGYEGQTLGGGSEVRWWRGVGKDGVYSLVVSTLQEKS